MSRTWHIISYDVREERRLRLVAHLLEGHGERIQYSVFRCRLTKTQLSRLRLELALVMAPEDNLLVIPLCQQCGAHIADSDGRNWGDGPPPYRLV